MTKTTGNFTDFVSFSRASGGTYLDSDGLIKTAATNVPRVEYDASGNRKGLLIEEARTNLVTYSEAAVGVWPNTNATLTQLSNSYFGAFAGVRVASAGQTWHRVSHSNVSHTAGTIYTVTMYFAEETSPTWSLQCFNGSTTPATQVQLSGTFGSASYFTLASNATMYSYSVEDLGNGVHKAQISYSINNSLPLQFGIGPNSTVVGDSIIALGAQLEAGAFPTSYIPTTGATATRAADICSIATSAFGYNQGAGTIVVEAQTFGYVSGNTNRFVSLNDTTNVERILQLIETNGTLKFAVFDGGVSQASIPSVTITNGVAFKTSATYKPNDFAIVSNGSAAATDTAGALPTVTQMQVGSELGLNYLNGHIKSIAYYPRRLTNAQIQALTA